MNFHYLSEAEAARLVATYHYTMDSNFRCEEYKENLLEKWKDEDRVKTAMEMRGCEGISGKRLKAMNFEYYGCFCRFKHSGFYELWSMYKLWKQSAQYPDGKPYFDQANKTIEIFSLFDALETERKNKEIEEQNRREKRRKR